MSIKIMGEVWECDLPTNELIVLLSLADHADHAGENVFPTIALTAWKTGYSCSQVQRIVSQLVKREILIKQERHGRAVRYRIDLSNVPHKQPYDRTEFNKKQREKRLAKTLNKMRSSKVNDQTGKSVITQNARSDHANNARSDHASPRSDSYLTINEPSGNHQHLTPPASEVQNALAKTPLPSTITPIRQPSVKLPPVRAKAPVPSKSENGSKPITPPAPPIKASHEKKPRKPPRYEPFWNAWADTFFGGARQGNQRLGRILHGQKSHGLIGLIEYETEHQKCTEDELDFNAMATWVPKFHASLPKDNSGRIIELRDPAKAIERWIGWRETTNRVDCPPKLFYDPNCPHHCDQGRVYSFDEKGMQTGATDCICVIRIRDERKGIKY